MEFEHIQGGDHGGGKGIKALALFKKKPVLMIGGLVVVILLVVFSKRGSSSQSVDTVAATDLSGYPIAGASGSGGATGISQDQVDQIQSSIGASLGSSLTSQINDQVGFVAQTLSDQFQTHYDQDQGKLTQYNDQFQAKYQSDLEATQAQMGKTSDGLASVTSAVDHLTTSLNTEQSKTTVFTGGNLTDKETRFLKQVDQVAAPSTAQLQTLGSIAAKTSVTYDTTKLSEKENRFVNQTQAIVKSGGTLSTAQQQTLGSITNKAGTVKK